MARTSVAAHLIPIHGTRVNNRHLPEKLVGIHRRLALDQDGAHNSLDKRIQKPRLSRLERSTLGERLSCGNNTNDRSR